MIVLASRIATEKYAVQHWASLYPWFWTLLWKKTVAPLNIRFQMFIDVMNGAEHTLFSLKHGRVDLVTV